MERNNIIIIGLIIVIIALVAGLAYMLMEDNLSFGEGSVPEGMQEYNFNSMFTMAVPEGAKFLKEFNNSGSGLSANYFDKNNEIAVSYLFSPIISSNNINFMINITNSSSNSSIEHDGDLIIIHHLKSNGELGNDLENSNFTYSVFLYKNHVLIVIQGNDLELLKTMAHTLKFYE